MSDATQDNETGVTTESFFSTITSLNESNNETELPVFENGSITITESVSGAKPLLDKDSSEISPVFEAFIIIEIIMTALEVIIWVLAAIKIKRWRKNYRNQMLMQLSVVRFIKRVVFLVIYYDRKNSLTEHSTGFNMVLLSLERYIDFVMAILVFFFIKHMYDSLILVLVKIRENYLWRVVMCAWLLPIPISAVCTVIIVNKLLTVWWLYLLVCCLFRWPLMLLGTLLYLTIVYRILKDQIRKFARSLAIITFLMCLVINFYLFSKDVVELWCSKTFQTILVSYISGFLLNFFILCFYVILIVLNFQSNLKPAESYPNCSISIDIKMNPHNASLTREKIEENS